MTHTFMFQGIYDTAELAEYIGETIGIRLIAKKSGDVVHGHINQSLKKDEKNPQGFTILTIVYNEKNEAPNWDEKTKQGHQSHLKSYNATEQDYIKIQEALLKLFNNETDSVRQLSTDEIDKMLGMAS